MNVKKRINSRKSRKVFGDGDGVSGGNVVGDSNSDVFEGAIEGLWEGSRVRSLMDVAFELNPRS